MGRTTALSLSSWELAHTLLPQSLSATGGVSEASVQGLAPVERHALSEWMLLSCRVGPTADWQRKVPHTEPFPTLMKSATLGFPPQPLPFTLFWKEQKQTGKKVPRLRLWGPIHILAKAG